jgi:hypothetical protein
MHLSVLTIVSGRHSKRFYVGVGGGHYLHIHARCLHVPCCSNKLCLRRRRPWAGSRHRRSCSRALRGTWGHRLRWWVPSSPRVVANPMLPRLPVAQTERALQ